MSRDIAMKGSELTTSYEGERGKERKKEKTKPQALQYSRAGIQQCIFAVLRFCNEYQTD